MKVEKLLEIIRKDIQDYTDAIRLCHAEIDQGKKPVFSLGSLCLGREKLLDAVLLINSYKGRK